MIYIPECRSRRALLSFLSLSLSLLPSFRFFFFLLVFSPCWVVVSFFSFLTSFLEYKAFVFFKIQYTHTHTIFLFLFFYIGKPRETCFYLFLSVKRDPLDVERPYVLAVLHSTDVPVDTFGSRSLAFAGYTTKHRLSSFDRPRSFDPYSDSYSTSVHIVYTVYTYMCVCV